MSDSICKKPVHISATALTEVMAEGVARALEARKAAGVELSADDVKNVSGAAYLAFYRAGGIPVDPWGTGLQLGSSLTQPVVLPGAITVG
jgi:hypothetical protein